MLTIAIHAAKLRKNRGLDFMTNSDFHRSADSTSERTGHCPLCWTYSKSDDYCSSFEEAIASTAERPMGCPWFTSEDRANWRARHKSSDGEPSNGKQPLMASRPAPPVPSDQTFHVAQGALRHLQCERCGEVAIASGTLCDSCAELSIPAAQPPAAPVEPHDPSQYCDLDACKREGCTHLADACLSRQKTVAHPRSSAESVPARETVARILAHKMPSLRMANDTPGNYAHSIADEIVAALFSDPPQEALAPDMWRCFHCNEVFTDKDAAQEHFGFWPFMPPGCVDRMRGDEKAIRKEMIDTERRFRDVCKQRDNLDAEVKQLRAQPLTLNEPQRSAGKESDVVAELRDRFADAKTKANESAKVALNSYGAGYDLGYHDALGELLEYLTAGVKK